MRKCGCVFPLRIWLVPASATQDGLKDLLGDETQSKASLKRVGDMCDSLGEYATGGVDAMRSLEFWRGEKGAIRENWVLVGVLIVYAQVGVDVLEGMREFNKARYPATLAR